MNADGLTRRSAMKTGIAALGACTSIPLLVELLAPGGAIAAASCARATPELTEGPYWVNTNLRRSDVRANSGGGAATIQQGVPLDLYINVLDRSRDCEPLNGLAVDIWHANAHGLYSDEPSQIAGGGTSASAGDTSDEDWLRGYQLT